MTTADHPNNNNKEVTQHQYHLQIVANNNKTQQHQLRPQANKTKKTKTMSMKTRTTIHTTTPTAPPRTTPNIDAGGGSHHSSIKTKRSNSNTTATSTTGATATTGSNNHTNSGNNNPTTTTAATNASSSSGSNNNNNKMKMKDVLETLISSVTCCTMLPTSTSGSRSRGGRYDHGIVEPPTVPTTTQYYWKRTRSLRPTSDDYLITAAKQGNVDKMRLLVESCHANVNYKNVYDESPLYVACLMGHEYCVRYLLQLNHNNSNTNTVHVPVVVVDVNLADSMGETPLFKATRRNAIPIVQLLVEHGSSHPNHQAAVGADIHKTNYWGDTCFMIATRYGYTDLVKYFMEHFGPGGGDRNAGTSALKSLVHVRNRCGETPLHLARQCHQHQDIYQLLQTAVSSTNATTNSPTAIPNIIQHQQHHQQQQQQQQQDDYYTTRSQ